MVVFFVNEQKRSKGHFSKKGDSHKSFVAGNKVKASKQKLLASSQRFIMRILKSLKETTSMKQTLFRDLVQECQLSIPGSKLSEKLKRKIEEFEKDDIKDVVGQTEEGCAPLFLACKNGSADVVEYLLNTCGADIEQRGVFEVAEEGVSHSVTPLWCAAVAGRLSVVKVRYFLS